MSRPTFEENLAAQMEVHGINGVELARRVRVNPATVTRWAQGRLPDGQDLLAVARVFGLDPYVLAGASFVEPLAALPVGERPRAGRRPKASSPAAPVISARELEATLREDADPPAPPPSVSQPRKCPS